MTSRSLLLLATLFAVDAAASDPYPKETTRLEPPSSYDLPGHNGDKNSAQDLFNGLFDPKTNVHERVRYVGTGDNRIQETRWTQYDREMVQRVPMKVVTKEFPRGEIRERRETYQDVVPAGPGTVEVRTRNGDGSWDEQLFFEGNKDMTVYTTNTTGTDGSKTRTTKVILPRDPKRSWMDSGSSTTSVTSMPNADQSWVAGLQHTNAGMEFLKTGRKWDYESYERTSGGLTKRVVTVKNEKGATLTVITDESRSPMTGRIEPSSIVAHATLPGGREVVTTFRMDIGQAKAVGPDGKPVMLPAIPARPADTSSSPSRAAFITGTAGQPAKEVPARQMTLPIPIRVVEEIELVGRDLKVDVTVMADGRGTSGGYKVQRRITIGDLPSGVNPLLQILGNPEKVRVSGDVLQAENGERTNPLKNVNTVMDGLKIGADGLKAGTGVRVVALPLLIAAAGMDIEQGKVVDAMKNIGGSTSDVGTLIEALGKAKGLKGLEGVGSRLGVAGAILQSGVGVIKMLDGEHVDGALDVTQAVGGAVFALVSGPIGWTALAVTALAYIGQQIWEAGKGPEMYPRQIGGPRKDGRVGMAVPSLPWADHAVAANSVVDGTSQAGGSQVALYAPTSMAEQLAGHDITAGSDISAGSSASAGQNISAGM